MIPLRLRALMLVDAGSKHAKKCVVCGKSFYWRSGRQTVCSVACQRLVHLEKKKIYNRTYKKRQAEKKGLI